MARTLTPMCKACTSLQTRLITPVIHPFNSHLFKVTKQRCYSDRDAGLKVLILEVDGDLCDGEDEEGGDVGGHQLVHRVPLQPACTVFQCQDFGMANLPTL